jgi:hypothetical protein
MVGVKSIITKYERMSPPKENRKKLAGKNTNTLCIEVIGEDEEKHSKENQRQSVIGQVTETNCKNENQIMILPTPRLDRDSASLMKKPRCFKDEVIKYLKKYNFYHEEWHYVVEYIMHYKLTNQPQFTKRPSEQIVWEAAEAIMLKFERDKEVDSLLREVEASTQQIDYMTANTGRNEVAQRKKPFCVKLQSYKMPMARRKIIIQTTFHDNYGVIKVLLTKRIEDIRLPHPLRLIVSAVVRTLHHDLSINNYDFTF